MPRRREFDFLDLLILRALARNPLANPSQIGAQINRPVETVRVRIRRLKANNILRPDGPYEDPVLGLRTRTEVRAAYSPYAIGLRRLHVFLEQVQSPTAMNKLIKLTSVHPYTHYNVSTFSTGATLYLQFDIPPSMEQSLRLLLDKLQEEALFVSFNIIDPEYVMSTAENLSYWDFDSQWQMNGIENNGESNIFERLWNAFESDKERQTIPVTAFQAKKDIVELDTLDASLLRELTINAKASPNELSTHYERSVSTISRRLSRLKEQCISTYILHYDRRRFDLSYSQIITGEFKVSTDFTADKVMDWLSSDYFPFRSSIITQGNQFHWHIVMPPSLVSFASEFVWTHAKNIRIHQPLLNTANSFYFYYPNYLGEGKWNTDKEYFIDAPLRELGL